MSHTDSELLGRYTQHHAEDAFAEIVQRYLGLVYSAALRQVRSPQLAEEVTQSAFIDLARSAAKLKPDTILTAWLYQVTRRTAIDVIRREASRQIREQVATEMNAMNATATDWTHIEPVLDEAMHALNDIDRTAVLLRYFENKSLREVGATLGTTDDAARKRVNRAVACLREFFAKHGVNVGTSGLVVAMSTNAIQAAPAGLAVTVSASTALAGISTISNTAVSNAIAMTTLQKTLIATALTVVVGTGIYATRRTSLIQAEAEALRQQQTPLTLLVEQLANQRDDASNRLVALRGENDRLKADTAELLKLRSDFAMLRRQQEDMLTRFAGMVTPQPRTQRAVDAVWVERVLNGPLKEQGAAAGTLRRKMVRGEMNNISTSEIAVRDALLQRELNRTLETSPMEFSEFQTAFVQAVLEISDNAKTHQIHEIILDTYQQAVAAGLDLPSKPESDEESWVQRRFRLDREATAQVKQILTSEERILFDSAFLGVMGIDLGGVGVDTSNYPRGFFGND